MLKSVRLTFNVKRRTDLLFSRLNYWCVKSNLKIYFQECTYINIVNDYIVRNVRLFKIINFLLLLLFYIRGIIHSLRNLNNQTIQIVKLKALKGTSILQYIFRDRVAGANSECSSRESHPWVPGWKVVGRDGLKLVTNFNWLCQLQRYT